MGRKEGKAGWAGSFPCRDPFWPTLPRTPTPSGALAGPRSEATTSPSWWTCTGTRPRRRLKTSLGPTAASPLGPLFHAQASSVHPLPFPGRASRFLTRSVFDSSNFPLLVYFSHLDIFSF